MVAISVWGVLSPLPFLGRRAVDGGGRAGSGLRALGPALAAGVFHRACVTLAGAVFDALGLPSGFCLLPPPPSCHW